MGLFKVNAISHEQVSSLNTAKNLTVPDGADGVYLQARTQDVYMTIDSSTPSASNGLKLVADDQPFYFEGDLSKLEFLEAAASATLHAAYVTG